jgi:hypothetical protein
MCTIGQLVLYFDSLQTTLFYPDHRFGNSIYGFDPSGKNVKNQTRILDLIFQVLSGQYIATTNKLRATTAASALLVCNCSRTIFWV